MHGIFTRSLNSIVENDLRELVEVRRLREHINLDYKVISYEHNRDSTIEMLADITAMANSQGGYIIIGIAEDNEQPDGTPKQLVGIPNGDTEAVWIRSVCQSSIDEKITDLQVRDIELSNGLFCVIVQVPNSIRKPYMIVYDKHRSFRRRHGREKNFMGMREVRDIVINMNNYRAELKQFVEGRIDSLQQLANNKPWFMLMATPVFVESEKLNPLRSDIRQLLASPTDPIDHNFKGIKTGEPKPRLFGIEACEPYSMSDQPRNKILRLFRNGHFEYCENRTTDRHTDWPQVPMVINSYRIVVTLIQFLDVAKRITQLGEISEPIAVTLHLENYIASYLNLSKTREYRPDDALWWRESSLQIQMSFGDLSDPITITRLITDRLMNAFGYEHNPYFDSNGNLKN